MSRLHPPSPEATGSPVAEGEAGAAAKRSEAGQASAGVAVPSGATGSLVELQDTAVVVLHHGNPGLTEATLERIRQCYPDASSPLVFVVENGPFPWSFERFPGVTRISLPENLGYGAGNNAGLRAALASGAAFIILLNNDVRVAPGTFEAMRRAAARPGVGLVGVILQEPEGLVWGGGRIAWWRLRTRLARHPVAPRALDYLHGACLGVTRSCVERVGMFREDFFLYWEDVDFGIRARRAGVSFAVAETTPLTHDASASGANADNASRKTYYVVRNAVHCAREWGSAPLRAWVVLGTPVRQWVAALRGKRVVARALSDAQRGVTGPAPEGW